MGRKHREAMQAARSSLDARYRETGATPTRPCADCATPTTKTVMWPNRYGFFPDSCIKPACTISCAYRIAGPHHATARWG